MKKLLLLVLMILSFSSCSTDDNDNLDFYFDYLPVTNVTVPEEFRYNEAYDIHFTYKLPSNCHFYEDLYYIIDGDNRNIAVISYVIDEGACEALDDTEEERSFKFICTKNTGSYVFEFWGGKDENGEDIYLTYEVPVN